MFDRRLRLPTQVFVVAVITATLTGCTWAVEREESAPTGTTSSSSSPPAHEESAECKWPVAQIEAHAGEVLNLDDFDDMEDLGPSENANGAIARTDDGVLASYTVAAGDTYDAIAERVCTSVYGLTALNAVRRGGVYASDDLGSRSTLYAGDTLNLNPFTIASVGDQNGVVHEHTPSFILPPQD